MQEIKNISSYKAGLHDKILHVAMRAFAGHGIRAVKMDDIAASLAISKRTLYELYGTKADLLYEGVRWFHALKHEKMTRLAAESSDVIEILVKSYRLSAEEFRVTSPAFYSDLQKYPKVLEYLHEQNRQAKGSQLQFFRRGVDEGFFRSDIDYTLASLPLDNMSRLIMNERLYEQHTIEEIFSNLVFVVIRGLCTPKGIATLEAQIAKTAEVHN